MYILSKTNIYHNLFFYCESPDVTFCHLQNIWSNSFFWNDLCYGI